MGSAITQLRPKAGAEVRAREGQISLSDRRTDEMVFGFVGPVGSGVTKAVDIISNILEETYAYTVSRIKLSKIIEENAALVDMRVGQELNRHDRIKTLQKIGTAFRGRFGDSYLAEKCVEQIATLRHQEGGYEQVEEQLVVRPRRQVHIIDSLKNPAEVRLLREVYGDTFWLFGIFAPEEVRTERLRALGLDNVGLQEISSIDEEEGVSHGQRVRETIHQADFFVRNDGESEERLRRVLGRYLAILFNVGVTTPTQDEMGMYKAMSAAASSACLSRQVGAAIYSAAGELIGIGANDVPKKGGGLYSAEDGDGDHRCYKWGGKICHNDDRKQRLYASVTELLLQSSAIPQGSTVGLVEAALRKTDIRNLIEYSRAVHAEQEAIVSVARGQKAGIVGATMYVTTFPCHVCASLIVVSGIDRVLYIEPYVKSLARALHRDAISVRESEGETHVLFLQYEGVAPKNIIRLFNHGTPRKDDGKLIERKPHEARPFFPPRLTVSVRVSRLSSTDSRWRRTAMATPKKVPMGEQERTQLSLLLPISLNPRSHKPTSKGGDSATKPAASAMQRSRNELIRQLARSGLLGLSKST